MVPKPATSRELLHRLLRATDTSSSKKIHLKQGDTTEIRVLATKTTAKQLLPQPLLLDEAVRREMLLARQARKLLREDDMFRTARQSTSQNNNNNCMDGKNQPVVMTTNNNPETTTTTTTTAHRNNSHRLTPARTSVSQRIPDRRYNRNRDLTARKQQRINEFAAALKAIQQEKPKRKKAPDPTRYC